MDNGDPSKIYVCQECCRTFKHPGNFKQHLASHNRPPITCPPFPDPSGELIPSGPAAARRACPALLPLAEDRSRASPSAGGADDWECPECSETFVKDTELQVHMKGEHDIEMVLPPQPPASDSRTTSVKQEAAEEEEETAMDDKATEEDSKRKQEEEKNEKETSWQARGKKRKRGRGKEDRGDTGEKRLEVDAAATLSESGGTDATAADGGDGGEVKYPGNYYCDAPVGHLCYFYTENIFLNSWLTYIVSLIVTVLTCKGYLREHLCTDLYIQMLMYRRSGCMLQPLFLQTDVRHVFGICTCTWLTCSYSFKKANNLLNYATRCI